ncbi:MAG: hypothetical protein D6816_15990 [Bacteroidetes bacterium]|nr:MAG: hypothetical protein D6816_15990 [Bacteroidota bacterium]
MFSFGLCVLQWSACSQSTATGSGPVVQKAASKPGEWSFSVKDIEGLKAKFEYDAQTGWYYHKHWGSKLPKRRTLTADVNDSGYFVLCSNFFAPQKLDHTSIEVHIGEEVLKSDAVELDGPEHRIEQNDHGIFEVNYYTRYRDNGIFQKIGTAGDKAVNVRFMGKRGYTDAELPRSDRQALLECFQLSLVLRQVGAR